MSLDHVSEARNGLELQREPKSVNGELDAIGILGRPGEGTPNRLICVPLGDGTHHLTVLHGAVSQRKHCW